jgi:hypothetical protein
MLTGEVLFLPLSLRLSRKSAIRHKENTTHAAMTLHLACHGLQVIETSEGKLDFAAVHSPVSNSQTTVRRGGVVEAGLRRGSGVVAASLLL